MKVVWKNGYAPRGVSAETAYEVIDGLNRQGKKEAKDLVDASRPEDAPLHPLFEWDDAIAAEKYRADQARCIIEHVFLVPEEDEPEKVPVRAFFHIDNSTSDYEPTYRILQDEDMHQKLLDMARRELQMFVKKYNSLVELKSVMHALDEFLHPGA